MTRLSMVSTCELLSSQAEGGLLPLLSISTDDSIKQCQQAFRPQGGRLITLEIGWGEPPRPEVKTETTLAYTLLGTDQPYGVESFKSPPEDRAAYARWGNLATQLFAEEKVYVRKDPISCHS